MNTKDTLIATVLVLIIIVAVGVFSGWFSGGERNGQGGNEMSTSSQAVTAYFIEEIQAGALARLPGHPIEGLEQSMYMAAYPKLEESDFSGVETIGDTNPSGIQTSADATISDNGLEALFSNVTTRLGLTITSKGGVDRLLSQLATTTDNTSQPGSTNPLVDSCEAAGGNWLAEFEECEYISDNWCQENEGMFEACASACRHQPEAQVCTMQCVPVCKF